VEGLQDVLVTVVDNYQGEENDIILLSLVRSNPEGRIGFLATENRVCVALSRAKQGLFIMGNMDMLAADNKTWQEIRKSLQDQDAVGYKLPLR
jgi:superfamily I DNA and/or RNA helicase